MRVLYNQSIVPQYYPCNVVNKPSGHGFKGGANYSVKSNDVINIADPLTELRWQLEDFVKMLKYGFKFSMNADKHINSLGLKKDNMEKYVSKHGIGILPDITKKILKDEPLATISLTERHTNKPFKADINRQKFNDRTRYVLKQNDEYCGSIDVINCGDNCLKIDYLTNVFGRDRFKNTENILLQSSVEDYIRTHGKVPSVKCIPENLAQNMNRLYNNRALYYRMGMKDSSEKEMVMNPEDVKIKLKQYIKHNGEIISGSSKILEDLNVNK